MKSTATLLFICSLACVAAETRLFPHLRKRAHVTAHHQHAHSVPKAAPVAAAPVAVATAVLPEVPPLADMGSKGYPELPGVSSMLSSASEKAKAMSSQAGVLQSSIARAQQETEAKLAQQKHVYEKKLRKQEAQNTAAIALNSAISQHISTLNTENDVLRNTSRQIRDTNLVMKSEFLALKERLGGVRSFVVASLAATEETKEKSIEKKKTQVAAASTATAEKVESDDASSDDDEEDDDEDDSDVNTTAPVKGTSLLALSQKVHRMHVANPADDASIDEDDDNATKITSMDTKDLLAVLQQGVASLTAEEKKSEKQLKDLFLHDFKVGVKRHTGLIAEQKNLNATEAGLETLQQKLKVTKKQLEGTSGKLQTHLHRIGTFLQQLSHLAMAPSSEATKLLEQLPTSVAISDAGHA